MPIGKPLKLRDIDEKDKKIIMLLQEDGRMQLNKISKKVGLSIDSVHKRIKEMLKKRIFETGIFIEPRALGYPLIADIKIKLKNVSKEERGKFILYLQKHKRCIELLSILGDFDFTCVLIAKDSNDLDEISTEIRQKFKDLILEWKGLLILKQYKFERYDLL
ncbi:MAG: Lrp/AsnC family transcriptional regulator, leucine-responsive regulatory protein [archaeon GW2011_AR13]|nr:MAG: Lrp/AsnC family transcriptional regulator, leucine-responsive regulatory protein [archaeon GW2011_AR13]HIG94119.1 Lrp/AsnC family transcriptional regulator [Nanoarchaeota archaeon]HIH63952.1 Lrp/AsnC family transcriptional regulator [Nanoarchaeota archaeon]HIJ09706.1 Lrp/AsnC family transcriptional regulator [Nanoarchaeota archaeon]